MVVLFVILFSLLGMAQNELKAISDSSQEQGIKLSPKAQINIGIKTIKINSHEKHLIPKGSLVHTKDRMGVYCLRDGWFKFVEVKVLFIDGESLTVTSKDLVPNEVIVSEGAALLRVSEMEAFSSQE